MPDEGTEQLKEQDNEKDYIAEIQKLKESTVSKEKYQKLLEDNKRLIQSLASGERGEAEGASAGATLEDLRKKLSNPEDMTNLEYVTAALELREKIMETGGDDPFLPNGTHARACRRQGSCRESGGSDAGMRRCGRRERRRIHSSAHGADI